MKLHLPKLFLTAVLAAVNTVGFQSYAEWDWRGAYGGYQTGAQYYYDKDADKDQQGTSYVVTEDGEYILKTNAAASSSGELRLCPNSVNQERTIARIELTASNKYFDIAENPWLDNAGFNYKSLTIDCLDIASGEGAAAFRVTDSRDTVNLKSVNGTLSSVSNSGVLTLGTSAVVDDQDNVIKEASTINLAGSMNNSGTLNLNGVIEIADLSVFNTILEGGLSNTTHGFRSGTEKAVIAGGNGTINLSGVTIKVGEEETAVKNGTLSQTPLTISTGNTTTSTVYEITSAYTTAVDYDGKTGETANATGFVLEDGTTLNLNSSLAGTVTEGIRLTGETGATIKLNGSDVALNHNRQVRTDGSAKVVYQVIDGTLTIDHVGDVTNISSIFVDGGTATVSNWSTNLGSSSSPVDITLTNGGAFTFNAAGGSRGHMYANINVDGSGKVAGACYGNDGNIHGSVTGNGTLTVGREYGNNYWTISGTISDGSEGKLAIEKIDGVEVIFTGANTYSGGTTVNAGKLTAANESALGTGKVTMKGGELSQNTNLTVSAMEYQGGKVNNNGKNLTVSGAMTVKSNMEIAGAGATTIGTLELAADTTLTTSGALTLGSITLDLTDYAAGNYTLVSAGGTISWNEKWTYTGLGTGLVANVDFADESNTTLQLTISAPEEEITSVKTSVTRVVGYNADTDMLTLEVKDKVTSGTMVSLTLITDEVLADIQAALNGADDMFRITVQYDETHKVVAESFDQVVFYNEKGQGYWGEMVDFGGEVGTKLAYKLDRIPEPTTTTLSLLALCGLAARRRRK